MHQFFIFANKNNSNFGGKLNAIQANYVNFNPEIYNGNIQIVFFYNLDNLNLSNGQTPIKRILCQGHRKLKIGGGALPFAWASILPYCSFFKLYISDPLPLLLFVSFFIHSKCMGFKPWSIEPTKDDFWTPPTQQIKKKTYVPAVDD